MTHKINYFRPLKFLIAIRILKVPNPCETLIVLFNDCVVDLSHSSILCSEYSLMPELLYILSTSFKNWQKCRIENVEGARPQAGRWIPIKVSIPRQDELTWGRSTTTWEIRSKWLKKLKMLPLIGGTACLVNEPVCTQQTFFHLLSSWPQSVATQCQSWACMSALYPIIVVYQTVSVKT